MHSYIAILRGINVTGHRKLPMAELRKALTNAHFKNVQTYIQSGNVLFDHTEADQLRIAEEISNMIAQQFGYDDVPVIVMTREELEKIANHNPFDQVPPDNHRYLHVTFLSKPASPDRVAEVEKLNFPEEEFIISGKAVYLYCPNGYGRTKLNNNFFEKKLQVTATTRNWKTVNKLLALSE